MQLDLSSFTIISTILCGILSIVLYHVGRLRLYRAAARFPGPLAIPIIGNAHYIIGKPEDILNKIMAFVKKYPDPFRFWVGHKLVIVVHNAEHLKTIFLSSKTIEKGYQYHFVRPWLGTGLVTAPVSKWRRHRKLISPTFNLKVVESFVEVFVKQSNILVQRMETELDGKEFDILQYVELCTLDIICESAMGVTVNAQTDRNSRYVEADKRTFKIILKRGYTPWLHPDIIFNRTQLAKDLHESLAYLHGFTDNIIQQKRIARTEKAAQADTIADNEQPPRRKAFLDLLMELSDDGTVFSDEELREEINTMVLAGSDTTGIMNCFVMLMLASHPEIQENVYKELYEIYGEDDKRDVACEDLNRMEYLERVIKETLRLFPIAPLLLRAVTEDLEIGEFTYPKGSTINTVILATHRNEEYWPNPFKFDPERFLPEQTAKRHPYYYVPFSAGPRNCIGQKFGMMSMKALLTTVLRRYTLKKDVITPIKDIQLGMNIMLHPLETIKIRIERRTPTIKHIQ